jgi:hypothetical protein
VLPLVLFALVALLGMAALTLDVGMMEWAKQRAQNSVDAAALAGGQKLASGVEATDAASSVAAANSAGGGPLEGVGIIVSPGRSITVEGHVNAPLSFAPVVGFAPRSSEGAANTLSVPASATVTQQNVCGLPSGSAAVPFGVVGDDPASMDPAVVFVSALLSGAKVLTPGASQPVSSQVNLSLRVWDSNGKLAQAGNFVPLLLSSTGTSYFDSIRLTTDQPLGVSQVLPNAGPSSFDLSYTRTYLAARLSPSNTAYSHAFAYYDPWLAAGGKALAEGKPVDHVLIIPIVAQSVKNQLAPVTILAFAAFWVDQPVLSGTSSAVAVGRFIGLSLPGGSGGICSDTGLNTPPRLST